MFSAFPKSLAPDVLGLLGESQICVKTEEKFEDVNPVASKSLVKAHTPHCPMSGFSSQSSEFCLTAFECLGAASCVTMAAALGLFQGV